MKEIVDEDSLDREAVQKTRGGETDAFSGIVRRYGPVLYRLAFHFFPEKAEAEEQVQEILMKAYKGLKAYNPEKRFFTWLYTVALNHLRSEKRKEKTRKAQIPAVYALREELTASSGADPEKAALRREALKSVRQAVDRLPRRYREVYILRGVEELSVADTAGILNLPEGTVKTNYHRARQKLKDDLRKNGGFDETG